MTQEKKDAWTNYVALATAAMAVLTGLTTLYMGKFSSRTVLSQMQESDQWAYYQAKSIKAHTYELQKERMELEVLAQKGKLTKDTSDRYLKLMARYDETIKRYDSEKKEIKEGAERLAVDKKDAQGRAGKFAYALIFLQLAIMMSSVASITKKKPLWYFGLCLSGAGALWFLDGFYLFY